MAVKKINKNERYMLKGSLRKCGFDRWRLVTCGISNTTGEERSFLFEFYVLNPAVSPKEAVLGFKSRFERTSADLQYALAGTEAAHTSNAETFVQPSYVMVKAAVLSQGGKHINAFFPCAEVSLGKGDTILRMGTEKRECMFSEKGTHGIVTVSEQDLAEEPELLCNSGSISWNLRFDRQISFSQICKTKLMNWACVGGKTSCSGAIALDGEVYTVFPKRSFGFYDKNWGKDFVSPFIHLSGSNFISKISGHQLESSCFALQGEFEKSLHILTCIEGKEVNFLCAKRRGYSVNYSCTEISSDEENIRLHWSVSVHNRKYVLDIDVFCDTRKMLLCDYESPAGGRKVLKVLGGGTGNGELRLYKKVHKNLELLEHVELADCLCEYGNIELPTV